MSGDDEISNWLILKPEYIVCNLDPYRWVNFGVKGAAVVYT